MCKCAALIKPARREQVKTSLGLDEESRLSAVRTHDPDIACDGIAKYDLCSVGREEAS
jgi:hypothetical protein